MLLYVFIDVLLPFEGNKSIVSTSVILQHVLLFISEGLIGSNEHTYRLSFREMARMPPIGRST
jgi:hypothetical protein